MEEPNRDLSPAQAKAIDALVESTVRDASTYLEAPGDSILGGAVIVYQRARQALEMAGRPDIAHQAGIQAVLHFSIVIPT